MKKLILILSLSLVVAACSNQTTVDDDVLVEGDQQETSDEASLEADVQGEVLGEQIEAQAAPVVQTPPPAPVAEPDYTMGDVAAHNTKADCWTAVNGGVYDLTEWAADQSDSEFSFAAICGVNGEQELGGSFLAGVRVQEQFAAYYLGDL